MVRERVMHCAECGGTFETVHNPVDLVIHGEEVTIEDVEYQVCNGCGEEILNIKTAGILQRRANDEYRKRHDLLNGQQIKEIRKRFQATQEEFQTAIGAGPKTLTRWEKGTVIQPGPADKLLRVIAHFPSVYEWLKSDMGADESSLSQGDNTIINTPEINPLYIVNTPYREDEAQQG